ncbi:MAG: hypothetical protein NC453_23700 [Muribaculum sp.]|nr:hypothetical protein [Muribaculum sp.]
MFESLISVIFWIAVAFGASYVIESDWCTPTIVVIVVIAIFLLKKLWTFLQG